MKLIPSEWPGSPAEQSCSALEILPISAVLGALLLSPPGNLLVQ